MNLSELVNDYRVIEPLVKRLKNPTLYPPQEQAFKTRFLDGKNLLMASPTSSGKTLIAQVAAMVNASKGKTVYLVPLRSLAQEKYNDFKTLYDGLLSVGLSIGDLTSGDERLSNTDLIISSYEKFDSLIRHKASWLSDVSLVVFDEAHLMNDPYRGPTIEVLMTKLKQRGVWVIGLSATIGNPREVSDWLNAELVHSTFRPVKLMEGLLAEGVVEFKEDELSYSDVEVASLCQDAIKQDKQTLVFLNTRRNAEAMAERLSESLGLKSKSLDELSTQVLHSLATPTSQCHRLAKCVKKGVAFNHAGLTSKQKTLIETAFRQGAIKVITCTTVLAYGVSLPAYRVIIRDFKRFTSDGMKPIPVSEYLQIAGRAGRAGYESVGQSILVTNNQADKELAWNEYLRAVPSELVSKLSAEPILRFHSLSLVCEGSLTKELIIDFFKQTFFGHDYGGDQFLESRIDSVISDLVDWGFIKIVNDKLIPTRLGLRVNELYLDPYSAHRIIDSLKADVNLNPIGLMHLAVSSGEVRPLRVRKSEYAFILEELAVREAELLVKMPSPFDYEYESFLDSFKTTLILNEWVNERGENSLMEDYGVAPGTIHRLTREVEWLLYAIGELSLTLGLGEVRPYTNGLITRVRYGIKSELLTLVALRGVGRVRARKLYRHGIKSVKDLQEVSLERLSQLLGPTIARKIKARI